MSNQSLFNEESGRRSDDAGKVTEIAPLPNNPNVKRIKVDGKVRARLSASDVEALQIEVGRKWTTALARRAQEAIDTAKARRAAMTMLGRRAFSRRELIGRLLRRGFSETLAQRVADDLEQNHWIDDAAYAASLADELVRRKGASRAMIIERLVKRGIDERAARRAADCSLEEVDQNHAATEFARKRLATMPQGDPQRAARRIAAALARRGYEEEVIADALKRAGILTD